ncbi:Aspartic peptidase domain superfamily [Arabidopsis thaliana x Arabidopsis arenosa]|uniref:Aspartic peptidase domain superfamily n=1 Tax=Arabidopsis thaliana x Arabidopsis arenosa TaxID=1240361 RepID=A0A8T1ZJZ7_9BRAS|nr:Aspartic peptidase domain superfamily [Arabidopsis thaliana x Arabidopsis arenosa]
MSQEDQDDMTDTSSDQGTDTSAQPTPDAMVLPPENPAVAQAERHPAVPAAAVPAAVAAVAAAEVADAADNATLGHAVAANRGTNLDDLVRDAQHRDDQEGLPSPSTPAAERSENQRRRPASIIVGSVDEHPREGLPHGHTLPSTRSLQNRPAESSDPTRDLELERMNTMLKDMSSKMHRATSSAPELEKVLEETQRSPFTTRISEVRVHHVKNKVKLIPYNGLTDPKPFLKSLSIAINRAQFSAAERDAGSCQLLVENLIDDALNWFSRLEANTIDSYHQLTSVFLQHHSIFMVKGTSNADLWTMSQKDKEPLRKFIERFKKVVSSIVITDDAAIAALRNACSYESRFREDLVITQPATLEDALHRANRFIEVEEEKAAMAKRQPKASSSKDKSHDEHNEPRQHYDRDYAKNDKAKRAATYAVGGSDSQPSKPWNKYYRETDPKRNQAYCEFHKVSGHSTDECRQLQLLLLSKFKKGDLDVEHERRQVAAHKDNLHHPVQKDDRNKRNDPRPNERARDNDRRPGPPKRNRDGPRHDDNAPVPRNRIHMIMGGLTTCRDSVRSIRNYRRQAEVRRDWIANSTPTVDNTEPISFTEADAAGLSGPHNDPLVVELIIDESAVTKVLIDTGSSVNVIFKDVLIQMGVDLRSAEHNVQPLTGFDGDTVMTVGTIMLPVYVGGTMNCFNFAVVDKPIVYNVILGTPWLHKMKAVASTYHQCVKFPTAHGIYTLRGDPLVARTCFIIERQLRNARAFVIAEPALQHNVRSVPATESVIQVNIDTSDPIRCVGIGSDLPQQLKDDLVGFLRQNVMTFAWSMADMTGIAPEVTCHELNVDSTYKPVKQKRRKLGPERATAVNEEVKKLLDAGSIVEVRYPDWLSNPVVVKKKNGKWRVCVDFTDLNKACPKDSFPLPRIDQLVEATAGNELLSFMDAFSGYNQILMHKNDREKTAFITDQGTFCYKVMPFGLKNAGATYQRLVNRMFADQLGRTMEVYIDDMLVKSTHAAEHISHLQQCFQVLNKYNMKLNPAKCTFGVTSGEFLGYLVTKRGIEANPKQISALINLPSPRNTREVQRLTGRIAALNRFISRSTDKCLPFYQLLRSNKKFEWDHKCEEAFKQLKDYLSTPPILAKSEQGETLYLYIAVSGSAVSGVLIREDRGEQHPIFYVSKTLDGAELRYPTLEKLAYAVVISARKLRPYFQSHAIEVLTNQPLRTVLHSPSQSGRIAKWAVELSEYDITYKNRTCAKSQVLADFLIELPPELVEGVPPTEKWVLHVDGASSRHGSGVGVRLESPTGEVLEQSFRLAFPASNNEAEYEALIAGLRLAHGIGVKKIQAYCDSQLVANQFSGNYEAKNDRMDAYLKVVREMSRHFQLFELNKIPRSDNAPADALAVLASTSDPDLRRIIPVESIDQPSIDLPIAASAPPAPAIGPNVHPIVYSLNEPTASTRSASTQIVLPADPVDSDWQTEIRNYIADGIVPADKWAARRLRARSAQYTLLDGNLCRWNAAGVLLSCLSGDETLQVMREIHEGAGGNHSGGRALALRIRKHGHYWPTMISDCERFVARCKKCQRHAPIIHAPTELLRTATPPYPFMRWAMDIVGPLPASRQKKYLLIMTDYFTKWVEAESYARIQSKEVQNFVWKHIICRHGLPYEIVTDNGTQFTSLQFEGFCAKWRIRLSKSTPRYPQGNGQAEATNKTIIDGLKKRLEEKKGVWADELDGVLWSHRTSPRRGTGQTPFSLAYGLEAVAPSEVGLSTIRRSMLVRNPSLNDKMLLDNLDTIEEQRDQALLRIQNYQQAAAKFYNKKVKSRYFAEGDLVLRKVFENTVEVNAGKLGAHWEGPYLVSKVVRPGVYELLTMDGTPIPRSWNSANLKRYYY